MATIFTKEVKMYLKHSPGQLKLINAFMNRTNRRAVSLVLRICNAPWCYLKYVFSLGQILHYLPSYYCSSVGSWVLV
ncbi:hypothetical protein CMV_022556 [Castanea mollissima]|uniref:Uncharacterized protein n=1 Tax=Castanea mollissima TaxID=60419 RepID=A0A8J4QI67_9ROSI|nr:hypothetical protein CMV_022556 [Castanea mollissima]